MYGFGEGAKIDTNKNGFVKRSKLLVLALFDQCKKFSLFCKEPCFLLCALSFFDH